MREIEFRYYDEERKCFRYWGFIPATKNSEVNIFVSTSEMTTDKCHEQFTGLLDKNGVEIYEGDIVRWSNKFLDAYKEEYQETLRKNSVVKWNDKNGEYYFHPSDLGWNMFIYSDIKVIGNIHENPDLLEQ